MAAEPEQVTPQPDHPDGWWAYPAVYAVAVYVAALVPNLPWWAGPAAAATLAVLGKMLARHTFQPSTHGEAFSWWSQALGVVAGLAAGSWLTYARLAGGPLMTWPWLVYGAAALGLAHLLLMWLAPGTARAQAKRATDPAFAAPDVALQVLYQGVLKRATQLDDVRVTEVVISPSGGVESVHLTPTIPVEGSKTKMVNRTQFTARLPHIVVELDRTLRDRAKPVRIDEQDVHVEQGAGGSEWIMHVTVARPLDTMLHFAPADAPQPWCGPKRCGRYEDDKPLLITFCDERQGGVAGEMVMTTGGGKTAGLNSAPIAHGLQSDQGEVWLVGNNKLIKLARPWLEPWLRGETDRPVIDWVAGEGAQAALRALASAYQYAVECNRKTKGNDARKPTRGKGALRVIVDECSYLLELRGSAYEIECCDGVKRNPSQLCAAIQKVGRTGPVELWKANQDALFDSFGIDGNKQRRNIGIGVAGECKTQGDAQRVIPGLLRADPTKLRNQAVYVEQSHEEPREVRARFDFIPDDQIPELARRYTPWRYGLDPQITARMPFYADRWAVQWHAAFAKEIEAEGLVWPTERPHTESGTQTAQAPRPQEDTAVTSDDNAANAAYRDPDDLVDLWGLFNTETPGQAEAPSTLANPNPKPMTDGFHRLGEWVREQEAKQHAAADSGIPDPLGIVIALLDQRGAPQEWVSTEVLAIATQRVAPDADEEAKRRASEQLGRELTAQDGMLTTQKCQRRVRGGVKKWGYPVPALRAAAERARRR